MPPQLIRFGLFELHPARRHLHKQGRRIRIQEQPLRVLEILLEEPGKLVTRQELKNRLWPADVYVDFELGLNGAMKRLRLALDDSADNPIFIETVPKSGYRFLAPVEKIPDASDIDSSSGVASSTEYSPLGGSQPPAATTPPPHRPAPSAYSLPRSATRIGVASVLVIILSIAAYLLRPLTPPLQITRVTNLTRSGVARLQENILSDGARIYYHVNDPVQGVHLRQILLNGGEDVPVEGIPADSLVRDLSPDHTTFLGVSIEALRQSRPSPLYAFPVVGGASRRLGNYESNDAAWSPDGNLVAFGRDSKLFIGTADGSGARSIASVPGDVYRPHWSPDGARVRFTVVNPKGETALWEARVDGTAAHALDFHWPGPPMEGYGQWSPDARYYFFTSARDGISNLWVLEERADSLHRLRLDPVRLTAGPISYVRPLPSSDGSKIFALGTESAGELLRYDPARHDFVQYLKGIGADQLNFSHDAAWIAYISYPDGTLWRMHSDGTQRLQLTQPSLHALNPRWSPDGKRILFVARVTGQLPKLFTISVDGGNLEPVLNEAHAQSSPTWSAAGDAIFFGRDPDGENQDLFLYRVDLKTGRAERLEGSNELYAPMSSPDGNTLTAQSASTSHELVLFDLRTHQRRVLSNRRADYPDWSSDSQYVYFNTLMYQQPGLYRVRAADSKIEKIADVPFLSAGSYGFWSGLAPDGSFLVLRSHVQTDVYSLSLH
jgi:Tol biopolymer transport system component/DNA-binding winged helix-turn-helix (wHTH) protein